MRGRAYRRARPGGGPVTRLFGATRVGTRRIARAGLAAFDDFMETRTAVVRRNAAGIA
ncbi:hypothetical protein C7S17_0443 [Burkholderia thailandensis]|nr:hypothetical protein [Burkholderia thailandensis]